MGREDRVFDAFVFVTPEYNHGTSGALKNAIDFLYRRVEQQGRRLRGLRRRRWNARGRDLRLVMGEIKVADVRAQVALSLFTDFENFSTSSPVLSKKRLSMRCSMSSSRGARRCRHANDPYYLSRRKVMIRNTFQLTASMESDFG